MTAKLLERVCAGQGHQISVVTVIIIGRLEGNSCHQSINLTALTFCEQGRGVVQGNSGEKVGRGVKAFDVRNPTKKDSFKNWKFSVFLFLLYNRCICNSLVLE